MLEDDADFVMDPDIRISPRFATISAGIRRDWRDANLLS
jgi:hypothetical protein